MRQKQEQHATGYHQMRYDQDTLFKEIKTKQKGFGMRDAHCACSSTWTFVVSLKATAAKTLFSQFS